MTNLRILIAVAWLASVAATYWLTASHYETLIISHGYAKRIRYGDGSSELQFHPPVRYGSGI
jgi:hypothetical protein